MRYSLFLNAHGGIEDDVIITRRDTVRPSLYLVANATRKQTIFARIQAKISALNLTEDIKFQPLDTHALIALQGPNAATVLEEYLGLSFCRYGVYDPKPLWRSEKTYLDFTMWLFRRGRV